MVDTDGQPVSRAQRWAAVYKLHVLACRTPWLTPRPDNPTLVAVRSNQLRKNDVPQLTGQLCWVHFTKVTICADAQHVLLLLLPVPSSTAVPYTIIGVQYGVEVRSTPLDTVPLLCHVFSVSGASVGPLARIRLLPVTLLTMIT
jgi:hypothetical protein